MFPFNLLYYYYFHWINVRKIKYRDSLIAANLIHSPGHLEHDKQPPSNENFNMKTMMPLIKKIGIGSTYLGIIFFLRTVILTGFAERAHLKTDPHPDDYINNNVNIFINKLNLYRHMFYSLYFIKLAMC